jgi:small multidrug resistance family-3 protein
MSALRIATLFVLAAITEIDVANHPRIQPWWFDALGVLALAAYGFVAAFQSDANFGRVLAAYGGIFAAGSLAWGVFVDGFKPTMWDFIGSTVCLIRAVVIIAAPAATEPICGQRSRFVLLRDHVC